MIQTYISIGSNIQRRYHILAALEALRRLDENLICSQIFEAEPVGFSGPNFYNAVVKLQLKKMWSLDALQEHLKQIERDYGRLPMAKKNEDRTLDLDILLFGDVINVNSPCVPRNDIFKFAFVLLPLLELCPDLIVPNDGRSVTQIWQDSQFTQNLWPVTALMD